jgi:hypothetical protein
MILPAGQRIASRGFYLEHTMANSSCECALMSLDPTIQAEPPRATFQELSGSFQDGQAEIDRIEQNVNKGKSALRRPADESLANSDLCIAVQPRTTFTRMRSISRRAKSISPSHAARSIKKAKANCRFVVNDSRPPCSIRKMSEPSVRRYRNWKRALPFGPRGFEEISIPLTIGEFQSLRPKDGRLPSK